MTHSLSKEDLGVINAAGNAIIGIDTGLAGDMNSIVGLVKEIGEAWYVPEVPVSELYHNKKTTEIRNLRIAYEAYSALAAVHPDNKQ